jgi:hypothetical protein
MMIAAAETRKSATGPLAREGSLKKRGSRVQMTAKARKTRNRIWPAESLGMYTRVYQSG